MYTSVAQGKVMAITRGQRRAFLGLEVAVKTQGQEEQREFTHLQGAGPGGPLPGGGRLPPPGVGSVDGLQGQTLLQSAPT